MGLVKEVEATPDWSLAGLLIEAIKGSAGEEDEQRICANEPHGGSA